ncbi:MAG: tRNA-dihydrouridine synthase [Patescibacteria group bacterium]|nr:tRNA-dihydrouridine synthase [Patescibacteria group bacterium]
MRNFWKGLPRPFTALAPMEGVTDTVFRQIILKLGRPDVFFTEFTNCDGIMSRGREKVSQSLKFLKNEKPIVAQIWGTNPKTFYGASKYCRELGFSGIDINMGCPIDAVVKKGGCAGLISNPKLAAEIIQATKEGGRLPVSVKTRIGLKKDDIDGWIGFLLEQNLDALTVHLRTVLDMSKTPARWDLMPQIIKLRDRISKSTLIIGNGDISSYAEIEEKYNQYKCDGLMVGRGVFSNPWIFNKSFIPEKVTVKERLELYIEHINFFNATWGKNKNPGSLKNFSKVYINNFADSTTLRNKINIALNTNEMVYIINEYRKNL